MLAITNADILSVKMDGTVIRAQAVVTKDDKIIFVGSDSDARDYIAEDTRVIDAGGNTVLPGLVDAHCHATWSGSTLFSCDLFGLAHNGKPGTVVEKIQNALREYIDAHPAKTEIIGCGWDMFDFMKKWPDRSMLDAVCPDKPVFLESYCQHHIWLNTRALEMAGITSDTPQPRNGIIYRDDNGQPTGLLSEFSAINLVKENIKDYDYTVEEYKEIIDLYQKKYARPYGVTMIFDALSTDNAKQAYREMAQDGTLTMRVCDNYYADPTKPVDQFYDMIKDKGQSDVGDLYRKHCVKFFMESAVPDTYFTEPYKLLALKFMHRPKGYQGFAYWTQEELREIFPLLTDAGYQIHTHAMGDGSVKHTLDAYEFAYQKTGRDTRNVLAHVMLVRPEDFARMAKSRVMACVQPTWMAMKKSDRSTTELALGRKRTEQLYPYKRFLDEGVVVSAGTDFPVTPPPDPFIEMEHAITRKVCRASTGYEQSRKLILAPKKNPGQDMVKITDVVKSRTISGAYQCFAENLTGSIEVGKSAELVILDKNLEKLPTNEIHTCKVMTTIFKGEIIYQI